MSVSRYFRLMLLSCLEMALTLPLGVYSIIVNTSGVTISPYKSWADTHYQFWRVLEIPAVIWRIDQSNVISLEMGRWIYPLAAFLFFALFGFAEEARRHYRAAFWFAVKPFGFKPCPKRPAFHNASRYAKLTSACCKAHPVGAAPSTLAREARSHQERRTTCYPHTRVLDRTPSSSLLSLSASSSPKTSTLTSKKSLTHLHPRSPIYSTCRAARPGIELKILIASSSHKPSNSTPPSLISLSLLLLLLQPASYQSLRLKRM